MVSNSLVLTDVGRVQIDFAVEIGYDVIQGAADVTESSPFRVDAHFSLVFNRRWVYGADVFDFLHVAHVCTRAFTIKTKILIRARETQTLV